MEALINIEQIDLAMKERGIAVNFLEKREIYIDWAWALGDEMPA